MAKAMREQLVELQKRNIELQAKLDALTSLLQAALSGGKTVQTNGSSVEHDASVILHRLTPKQHAVVSAVIAGLSYQEIANLMEANQTTVKLHLRAALTHLDSINKNHMLVQWGPVVSGIAPEQYASRFGVSNRWFEEMNQETLAMLREKRSSFWKGPEKVAKKRVRRDKT